MTFRQSVFRLIHLPTDRYMGYRLTERPIFRPIYGITERYPSTGVTDMPTDRYSDRSVYRPTDLRTDRYRSTDGRIYGRTDLPTDGVYDDTVYARADFPTTRSTDLPTDIPIYRRIDPHNYRQTDTLIYL